MWYHHLPLQGWLLLRSWRPRCVKTCCQEDGYHTLRRMTTFFFSWMGQINIKPKHSACDCVFPYTCISQISNLMFNMRFISSLLIMTLMPLDSHDSILCIIFNKIKYYKLQRVAMAWRPWKLLVYGINLTYGPPCALCEEIMKFGTDDLWNTPFDFWHRAVTFDLVLTF